jgi:hypothetical protein
MLEAEAELHPQQLHEYENEGPASARITNSVSDNARHVTCRPFRSAEAGLMQLFGVVKQRTGVIEEKPQHCAGSSCTDYKHS